MKAGSWQAAAERGPEDDGTACVACGEYWHRVSAAGTCRDCDGVAPDAEGDEFEGDPEMPAAMSVCDDAGEYAFAASFVAERATAQRVTA